MKRMLMVAGLLGIAAVSTGCGFVGGQQTENASYDVADKVAGLRIESDSGGVEVVESDRTGIRVSEKLTFRKNKPVPTHKVSGDTLELKYTCPGTSFGIGAGCEVAYRVEVPRGLRVEVVSDSGTVTLKALSGDVEATSDSGTIDASGLTGKRIVGKSNSGGLEFTFAAQPDKLDLSTDSGTTSVKVPKGAYKVSATTDSGSKTIDVASDPSATHTITLDSDSGSIKVSEV